MIFKNEFGDVIDHLSLERVEQIQAETYITDRSVVLELGARYGTVSCIINKKIAVHTNQVSVEPDETVFEVLEENMKVNGCNFYIVKGAISRMPCRFINPGYGGSTIIDLSGSVPHFTLEEIEAKYNLKFNTLVADCEGFLEQFFDENPGLYEQLELVIFECDQAHRCDYKKIMNNLFINGFERIENAFHQVWRKSDLPLE
jgi:FkbM family methyltransferase